MIENCNLAYKNIESPVSIEDPGSIPASEIQAVIFDGNPKNIIIKNGHSKLQIPDETLQAISVLPLARQTSIMTSMSEAIKDASRIVILPKK